MRSLLSLEANVRRRPMLGHRCLGTISRIRRENCVSDSQARCKIVDPRV